MCSIPQPSRSMPLAPDSYSTHHRVLSFFSLLRDSKSERFAFSLHNWHFINVLNAWKISIQHEWMHELIVLPSYSLELYFTLNSPLLFWTLKNVSKFWLLQYPLLNILRHVAFFFVFSIRIEALAKRVLIKFGCYIKLYCSWFQLRVTHAQKKVI